MNVIDLPHMQAHPYRWALRSRSSAYLSLLVRAGKPKRQPDPLIEDATVDVYPARVEVTVSPTGRSVQVHVNGEKVWP